MDVSINKAKRFRFLEQEQFAVLTAQEKLAYLNAAITELQRCSRPSEKHHSQSAVGQRAVANESL
jgi:hypothetical protein